MSNSPPQQRDLVKLMMMAKGTPCHTPNKEPIRIGFKFWQAAGPLQDGNLVGDTTPIALANLIYGAGTVRPASSSGVWCPGLERKCVQIFALGTDLATFPVVIQANIRSADLQSNDWTTISGVIQAPGIYPIGVVASSAVPFMFEPEITLLRIMAFYNAEEQQLGVMPPSIEAVFSGYWGGVGKWTMQCVNSYQGD